MSEVTPLRPDHAAALAALFRALRDAGEEGFFHPHPLTDAEARTRAEYRGADAYCVLVAGGRLVAYGFLRGWDDGYDVPSLGIAVHPEHRGRGFAKTFMQALHAEARTRGASRVRLTVDPRNVAAQTLYRTLGYVFQTREDGQLVGLLPLVPEIYVSTACLPGTEPLLDRLDRFAAHGLVRVELGGGVTCDASKLGDLAGRHAFLVHNYFPPPASSFVLNLASADAGIRDRSLALVRNALDLCATVRAPYYSVHAGFVTDAVGREGTGFAFPAPPGAGDRARALERFIRAIEDVAAHARGRGVGLLVENNVCRPSLRGRLLLDAADECVAFFRHAPRGVRLLLDTGHLNVTASTYGFDRLAFVAAVAPYVGGFHLHDNDGTDDWHEPVRPGSWVLDAVRGVGRPAAPVVIEGKFESVAALQQQAEWLRSELAA